MTPPPLECTRCHRKVYALWNDLLCSVCERGREDLDTAFEPHIECATCGDFVDNRGFCVEDMAHESGYRCCPVCDAQGETDGETCYRCYGAGCVPSRAG